jgi:hypothetical protein
MNQHFGKNGQLIYFEFPANKNANIGTRQKHHHFLSHFKTMPISAPSYVA